MVANKEQVAALVDMFHTGVRQEYARGEFLVRPGSQPPGVFYVESGLVKAYDITKYGEENLLILRSDGEILGLTWALTRQDRDVIYTALAPTVVWVVSRERFITHIQEHPEAAVPVVSLLADMYRLHGERIITLEYRTVRERLASFLLGIAERFGTQGGFGTGVFYTPLAAGVDCKRCGTDAYCWGSDSLPSRQGVAICSTEW